MQMFDYIHPIPAPWFIRSVDISKLIIKPSLLSFCHSFGTRLLFFLLFCQNHNVPLLSLHNTLVQYQVLKLTVIVGGY